MGQQWVACLHARTAGSKRGPECRGPMPGAVGGRCLLVESCWLQRASWPWPGAGGVRVRGRVTGRASQCLSTVLSLRNVSDGGGPRLKRVGRGNLAEDLLRGLHSPAWIAFWSLLMITLPRTCHSKTPKKSNIIDEPLGGRKRGPGRVMGLG